MTAPQAVLWLDHREARFFSLDGAISRTVLATPPGAEVHRPNKPTASGRRDAHAHEHYYRAVQQMLGEPGPLLLCGPSTAKLEFSRYLAKHAPQLARRVAGVQTVDHPTDRQLITLGRRFFGPEEPPPEPAEG